MTSHTKLINVDECRLALFSGLDVGEIVDRISIKLLYSLMYSSREEYIKAKHLLDTAKICFKLDLFEFEQLCFVNSRIWGLESTIREGSNATLTTKEIGQRAIEIRDLNKERNRIKASITQKNL